MAVYRGIEIPEELAKNIGYRSIWERGVDVALDSVMMNLAERRQILAAESPLFFTDAWTEGCFYGHADELTELESDMKTEYKKENN